MNPSVTRRRFLRAAATALGAAPFVARGATMGGFEIGLVADSQYANIEPRGIRHYREGLPRLEAAVEAFNRRELAFCVHLGDLIERGWSSFDAILAPLGRSRHRWYHLLGNHDFDVPDEFKTRVPARMGMPARYYLVDHGSFRFAALDTTEISTFAHPTGSPGHARAAEELARLRAANVVQAKSWNGGVSATQLEWLDRACTTAKADGRKVVVFAHHPVAPVDSHLVWNNADLLDLVDRYPNIVAWINGHNHAGAYTEHNGVPFLTLRAMVEAADTTAFATAQILADRIVVHGHGREPSRELLFRS